MFRSLGLQGSGHPAEGVAHISEDVAAGTAEVEPAAEIVTASESSCAADDALGSDTAVGPHRVDRTARVTAYHAMATLLSSPDAPRHFPTIVGVVDGGA